MGERIENWNKCANLFHVTQKRLLLPAQYQWLPALNNSVKCQKYPYKFYFESNLFHLCLYVVDSSCLIPVPHKIKSRFP